MTPINSKIKYLIFLVLAAVGIWGWNTYSNAEELKEQQRKEDEEIAETRNYITNFITAGRSAYQYSGFGGISGLSIHVNNKTKYMVDKVVVKVSYFKPSGAVWKEKMVEFNYINPWQTMENDVADEPRGVRIEYQIVSITSRALGML